MVHFLHIRLFFATFAKGIGGSHDLLKRENLTPPFPFNKGKVIERVSKMSRKKTIDEVVETFKVVWGDTYDYSLIKDYKNNKEKLPIICPKHGAFYQSFLGHSKHHGCPICANEKTSKRCKFTIEQFKEKAKNVHGDKYDYSLITKENYIDTHHKVSIICPMHGVFNQTPHEHLSGRGCYFCGKESMAIKQRYEKEELVSLFNKIHNNKYDYSLFDGSKYKCRKDKISVVCPIHGVFYVSVSNHLYRKSGCPMCNRSLGEERIACFLNKHNILYKEQYCFRNEDLFCKNIRLQADFYLYDKHIVVEYNGIQHYKEIEFFNFRTLQEQQERDLALQSYCNTHNIKLIVIPYTEYDNIEAILSKGLLKEKWRYG